MKKALTHIFLATLFISLSACTALKTPNTQSMAVAQPMEKRTDKLTDKLTDKETNKPQLNTKKCVCIQLWMPVCGENGKTYSNACFAKCANVKFKQGSCTKDISD